MIHLLCPLCKHGMRISGGDAEQAINLFGPTAVEYPDKFSCYNCGKAEACVTRTVSQDILNALVELVDVTPQEAFIGMYGMGMPNERDCTAEAVRTLLVGAKIRDVAVQQIKNSHRCVIHIIELEDGTRVHLGSSANGALVVKVASSRVAAENG